MSSAIFLVLMAGILISKGKCLSSKHCNSYESENWTSAVNFPIFFTTLYVPMNEG